MFDCFKMVEKWGNRLEDRAEVIAHGEALVVVVADGAGGRAGGAEAADLAVRLVREFVLGGLRLHDPFAWCGLLQRIDRQLQQDGAAGETTLVAASLCGQSIVGASVGDSGAWLIGLETVLDLTAGQRRKPFLGTACAVPVPFVASFTEGTLLLASDGLFKYADQARISEVVRDQEPEKAVLSLVNLVRLPSGALQDDVAVVLARPA